MRWIWCATILLCGQAAADEARLPEPPVPPRIATGEQYERCLGMLADDPSGAAAFAETWAQSGGGDGAAHCAALASIELGDAENGARALDALAAASAAASEARAQVIGQAAHAWLLADDTPHAYDSASRALELAPDDVDLLIELADITMTLGRYAEAIDNLDRALVLDLERADALVLRAGALRELNRVDRAMSDVTRAIALDPENADALLERGILRQRAGDRAGAKADWTRAIALDPDSEAADLAQQNLSLLEAGPDQAGGSPPK